MFLFRWSRNIILVIPFFEELFFRGFIQTSLMRTGSPAAAIIAQGVLFGLVHMGMPASVDSLTIFGLALGYAFYRTRSLVSCFLMHAAFNLRTLIGDAIGVYSV